jgi:hypothetical protein
MNNTNDISINYFNPDVYIGSLMTDIGFDDANDEEKDRMYKGLSEQVSHLILNAISLYVEPEQIDETLIIHGDLHDLGKFIEKLVENSPEAQFAIIEALDRFYQETVDTYEEFNKI